MKNTVHTESYGSLKSYIIGFVLSLLLTFIAFFLVTEKWLTTWHTTLILSALAIVQAFVQLVFFLHLGQEKSPYWNLQTFLFMLGVLAIIVLGSLWIMYNLDYHMMVQ